MRRTGPAALFAALLAACGSANPSSPGAHSEPGETPGQPPANAPTAPAPTSPAADTPAVELGQVFPELDGFGHPAQPDTYTPANLYDYIDGAAELFLHYGFVELASLEYRRGSGDAEQSLTADVYRQSSANNGYGIYSRDHVRAPAVAGIGAAAVLTSGALQFVKGRYYVKLTGFGLGEKEAALLRRVATAIAARLDGPDGLPPPVACFPADPVSPVEYHASGYLGHGFLVDVFAADYRVGSATEKLLLLDTADPAAAAAALTAYSELARRKGETVTTTAGTTRLVDPYHRELGPLFARQHDHFLAIVFAADPARAAARLDRLATCLARPNAN